MVPTIVVVVVVDDHDYDDYGLVVLRHSAWQSSSDQRTSAHPSRLLLRVLFSESSGIQDKSRSGQKRDLACRT